MIFRRRTPLSPSRPANNKIRTYVNSGGKIFYAASPSTITLQTPPPHTPKAAGSSSASNGKTLHLCHAAATISIIVGTALPHQCPDPTKPPYISVAFFVTLRFSNLVPYVAILKTFHVKIFDSNLKSKTLKL